MIVERHDRSVSIAGISANDFLASSTRQIRRFAKCGLVVFASAHRLPVSNEAFALPPSDTDNRCALKQLSIPPTLDGYHVIVVFPFALNVAWCISPRTIVVDPRSARLQIVAVGSDVNQKC